MKADLPNGGGLMGFFRELLRSSGPVAVLAFALMLMNYNIVMTGADKIATAGVKLSQALEELRISHGVEIRSLEQGILVNRQAIEVNRKYIEALTELFQKHQEEGKHREDEK